MTKVAPIDLKKPRATGHRRTWLEIQTGSVLLFQTAMLLWNYRKIQMRQRWEVRRDFHVCPLDYHAFTSVSLPVQRLSEPNSQSQWSLTSFNQSNQSNWREAPCHDSAKRRSPMFQAWPLTTANPLEVFLGCLVWEVHLRSFHSSAELFSVWWYLICLRLFFLLYYPTSNEFHHR